MESQMSPLGKSAKPTFKDVTAAWTVLHKSAGIGVIRSEQQYRRMSKLADQIVDEIGSNENHPLAPLLDLLASLIEQYESENVALPGATPGEVLAYLMQEHGLKQVDLREEIGTQGVVSEVLRGKRRINGRQAKALAQRFGVSAAVFL
jgi:HTH-type transcriptional regulator / antitoxin HigA